MSVGGDSYLYRLLFSNNNTELDYGGGGGLELWGGSALIENSAFIDNYNNFDYNTPGSAIIISQYANNVDLRQVTMSNNNGGNGTSIYSRGGALTMTNVIVANHPNPLNNLVGVCIQGGSATIDGVLWYGNYRDIGSIGNCPITPTVDHEVTGDPAFDSDGYHITPASAAVNAGVTLASVTDDIDGGYRPKAILYDLGADELNYFVWLPVIIR
jgi:hypothetical protein